MPKFEVIALGFYRWKRKLLLRIFFRHADLALLCLVQIEKVNVNSQGTIHIFRQ